MDKKIKRAWLKYLRSGKYKQTRHQLKNSKTGGYCCLGVLCKCLQNHKYPGVKWDDNKGIVTFQGRIDDTTLPSALEASLGIPDQYDLIALNDNKRRFKTIANWIEKNL